MVKRFMPLKQSRGIIMHFLIIIPFLFISETSSFANNNTIDSLQILLSRTTSESEILLLKKKIFQELINTDFEQARSKTKIALRSSKLTGDKVNEARALNHMGLIIYDTKEISNSLEYFEQSESLAKELGLKELQVRNLLSIAKYHIFPGTDSAKVVMYFLKSVEVSKSIDAHLLTGEAYGSLAAYLARINQVEQCKYYLDLSIQYFDQHPNTECRKSHIYTTIGDKIWKYNTKLSMDMYFKAKEYKMTPKLMMSLAKVHRFIGQNKIALNYIKEAILELRKSNRLKKKLAIAISELANIYFHLGDYKSANKSSDEGIALLENAMGSTKKALPDLYITKAKVYEKHGNDEEALKYFTRGMEEAKLSKSIHSQLNSTLALGMFYSTRDSEKAKSYCLDSYEWAKSKKHTNFEIESCDCLYNIYNSNGNFKAALSFLEQKFILRDSVNSMAITHALDMNNKIVEKDKLIAEQSYQKESKEKELKNQYKLNTSLSICLLLGILMGIFMIKSHRRVKRINAVINEKKNEILQANIKLERSNEELERFAHVTSHDLKTPIRSIVSFTSLLRRRLGTEEKGNVLDLLDFIEDSGKRLNQLIEDVLEYSKLSGEEKVELEFVDLNKTVFEITQLINNTSISKSVKFEITELPHIKWYPSRIFLLLKNIIENGIKYNDTETPIIKVYYKNNAGEHAVYVEDNGIGIEKEYFDNIFVMFNRLHNHAKYEGTGLGLATCQKIVENFNGEITVFSKTNEGSTFKIEFPTELIHHSVVEPKNLENKVLQEIN